MSNVSYIEISIPVLSHASSEMCAPVQLSNSWTLDSLSSRACENLRHTSQLMPENNMCFSTLLTDTLAPPNPKSWNISYLNNI